jgi:hypothetical protein
VPRGGSRVGPDHERRRIRDAPGVTLAIGGPGEDSNATGIDGNQADDTALASGAVYVLVRDGMGVWSTTRRGARTASPADMIGPDSTFDSLSRPARHGDIRALPPRPPEV